jgi:KDO2-lipid IV(A) lauroyltransferase
MVRAIPFSKKCRYASEAAIAYFVYGLFRLMPVDAASAFGGGILKRLGPRMGISRVAMRNLALAFPDKTAAEKHEIVRGMWENLGRVLGEYPHLRRMSGRIELIGKGHVEAVRNSGKPCIFFAGHLANWEINAICAKANGLQLHLVYRKPNNPYVDGILRHARAIGTAGYIEKGISGAHAIRSVIKNNGTVALLADQKLSSGMAIPFFGHDAMTAPALAHFALKFGLPVYPSQVERLTGARFRVTVHPPLAIVPTGNMEEDTRNILTEMNRQLEEWIRAHPEQWLWIHKRWPESL